MNTAFFVMSLGVFLVAAFTCSGILALLFPWLNRQSENLSLPLRSLLWKMLAALPLLAGTTAWVASMFPAFGFSPDHCIVQQNIPHLCHVHNQPLSIPALLIAWFGLARVTMVVVHEIRVAQRAHATITSLEFVARLSLVSRVQSSFRLPPLAGTRDTGGGIGRRPRGARSPQKRQPQRVRSAASRESGDALAHEFRRLWIPGSNFGHAALDVRIVPGAIPSAFVLGALRPRIFVTSSMLDVPSKVLDAAIAHETCHATQFHLLKRLFLRLLASLHMPHLARKLDENLAACQEFEADSFAARKLGDKTLVAESLLHLSRARLGAPLGALGFSDGILEQRVHFLVDQDSSPSRSWPLVAITFFTALAIILALSNPGSVHDLFEAILGWPH